MSRSTQTRERRRGAACSTPSSLSTLPAASSSPRTCDCESVHSGTAGCRSGGCNSAQSPHPVRQTSTLLFARVECCCENSLVDGGMAVLNHSPARPQSFACSSTQHLSTAPIRPKRRFRLRWSQRAARLELAEMPGRSLLFSIFPDRGGHSGGDGPHAMNLGESCRLGNGMRPAALFSACDGAVVLRTLR
jgi:hypothetical protein